MAPQIIIGVPGPWKTRQEIVEAIAVRSGGGLIFAGPALWDSVGKTGYRVDIYHRDPNLARQFEMAGQGRIEGAEIRRIAEHQHTFYLLNDGVSLEAARGVLRVGCGLLDAGGIAVKVETAGVAHSAATWREMAASASSFDTYRAFVTLAGDKELYYSCGMHNFGLPDATLEGAFSPRDAADVLNAFNAWRLSRSVALADGDQISLLADWPKFRLRERPCKLFETEHPFHNSFGIWHLELVGKRQAAVAAVAAVAADCAPGPNPFSQPGGEPCFIAIPSDDPGMLQAVTTARESINLFREYLRSMKGPVVSHSAKLRFRDHELSAEVGQDKYLYLWLNQVELDGDRFRGELIEVPSGIDSIRAGQKITFGPEEVFDWMVNEDGHVFGGFSLRVTERFLPKSQVADWRRYIGIRRFVPLPNEES